MEPRSRGWRENWKVDKHRSAPNTLPHCMFTVPAAVCHVLNLALTTTNNLPSVRRSMRTIQDIITFYKGQKRAAAKGAY